MNRLKKQWRKTPAIIRKSLVFVVGLTMVIAAPFLGWLPGPGGIPLFLLGIAILSSEFLWADRVRERVMALLQPFLDYFKKNPAISTFLIVLLVTACILIGIPLLPKLL